MIRKISGFRSVLSLAVVVCAASSSLALAAPDTTSVQAQAQAQASYGEREHTSMTRPNALSGEVLGRGGLYSVNYDRSFTEMFAAGAGISTWGYTSGLGTSRSILIVPVYGNFYFQPGPKRGFLTAGADIAVASSRQSSYLYGSSTSTSSSDNDSTFKTTNSGVAAIVGGGYEFRGESGFLFRATGYLLIASGGVLPWAGASFGGTF